MKVLITGGSGFIGTHLIKYLLEKDDIQIVNIDLNPSPINDSRLNSIHWDIRQEEVLHLEERGFDCCIHLAALCKEPGFEWNEYFVTNHFGTKQTIKLCETLDIDHIIFTSTMMVFKAEESVKVETDVTAPDTAYGISKLLGELELLSWQSKNKGKLQIIRPAVVFGENENANFTRLYQALKRGFFPYVGKSSTVKSNIYVKELVYFVDYLFAYSGEYRIFNFAFPVKQPMKEIVQTFKEVFGLRSINPVIPYRLLLLLSYGFELLNSVGLKNSVHHRRIQKLFFSTYIHPKSALEIGYNFSYDLKSALKEWKESGDLNS